MGRKWQDENPTRAAVLRRNWYLKNRKTEIAKAKARNRINKLANRDFVRAWKVERGCQKCGENHPAVLDLHHPRGSKKEAHVSDMVRMGRGRDVILKEIKKCEVLCSNCHRKVHYKS